MPSLSFLVTEIANALSQAALLFFLGVGLTLIFGIMRIVNFAHGAFYMLGAFIGYSAARLGGFWLALALAPAAVGIAGTLFELGILRGRPDQQPEARAVEKLPDRQRDNDAGACEEQAIDRKRLVHQHDDPGQRGGRLDR